MNNARLRDTLIFQAENAFLVLSREVDSLLTAAQFFAERPARTRSDAIKCDNLRRAVLDIAELIARIAQELARWKRQDDRVLSKLGVELQYLNELYVTMEALMLFLIREGIDLCDFSLAETKRAYSDLLRCNRLL